MDVPADGSRSIPRDWELHVSVVKTCERVRRDTLLLYFYSIFGNILRPIALAVLAAHVRRDGAENMSLYGASR